MPKKNQCTAIKPDKKRCHGNIAVTNNPNQLPLCYQHLPAPTTSTVANDNDNVDIEFGTCCFCNGNCNPASQACGRCSRKLPF